MKALAILVVYTKSIAIELGFKYQFVVFGLLLSIQGFCTVRQVLLSTIFYKVHSGRATLQDLEAVLRNSFSIKNASLFVKALILALAGLPLLLGALYKLFIDGSTINGIPNVTGQFGIIPPPNLDSLNGNGIALAVNRMGPFWEIRPRHTVYNATYGENMLVVDNKTTAMLDTPMISTFAHLRALLSPNSQRNQSLVLSADINATVATNVDIPAE